MRWETRRNISKRIEESIHVGDREVIKEWRVQYSLFFFVYLILYFWWQIKPLQDIYPLILPYHFEQLALSVNAEGDIKIYEKDQEVEHETIKIKYINKTNKQINK